MSHRGEQIRNPFFRFHQHAASIQTNDIKARNQRDSIKASRLLDLRNSWKLMGKNYAKIDDPQQPPATPTCALPLAPSESGRGGIFGEFRDGKACKRLVRKFYSTRLNILISVRVLYKYHSLQHLCVMVQLTILKESLLPQHHHLGPSVSIGISSDWPLPPCIGTVGCADYTPTGAYCIPN